MIRQGNAKDFPGDADNLTAEERQALEALAGSRESEARKQERAKSTARRVRHDYKRNGTTTLFAAFEVGGGEFMGRHYNCRRRIEFLDFMNHASTTRPSAPALFSLDQAT